MKRKLFFSYFTLIIILLSQSSFSQVFWEERPSPVTVPLNSVSNYDGFNAFLCGDSATVLKTTNRGYNWTDVSRNGIPANVNLVSIFISTISGDATVFTAGYSGTNTYLYKSTNSGGNWTQVFTQANGFINAVWFTSAASGFMQGNPVGGRWSLWKTTNSGVNWDSTGMYLPAAGTETGFKNSLWMYGNYIWFGTNNSRIYNSTNGGSNWIVCPTSTETNSNAVWLSVSPYTYAYASGNTLLKSVNAGLNWTIDTSAIGTGTITSFTGYHQSYNYLFYTRGSSIYMKTTSGAFWTSMYTAPAGTYRHMSMSRSGTTYGAGWIFAVRDNGKISRANTFVEGVRIISNSIPNEYSLNQNYPNPFNSTTKFKFDTRKLPEISIGEIRGGNVKISIYNILGKEVETIIDKVLQPAVYEVMWDAGKYSSGIYYYRMLITNPNSKQVVYSQIRKMVMIK
jgi:photosystem II stability/assembly factor-like uncharacterized protein